MKPKPTVDPALRPFLDVIAEMLVAQEMRLADARRVVRAIATAPTDTESPTAAPTKGDRHDDEARRTRRKK
jgi:hypothetical protein